MIWPDFIPVELEGMSILTAFVFFFIGLGSCFLWNLYTKEIKRIDRDIKNAVNETEAKIEDTNSKVDLLFEKIDSTNHDISEIKTHVARTDEAVQWIKRAMEAK